MRARSAHGTWVRPNSVLGFVEGSVRIEDPDRVGALFENTQRDGDSGQSHRIDNFAGALTNHLQTQVAAHQPYGVEHPALVRESVVDLVHRDGPAFTWLCSRLRGIHTARP